MLEITHMIGTNRGNLFIYKNHNWGPRKEWHQLKVHQNRFPSNLPSPNYITI